ncbi:MAG: MFS transporter [Anaerotardibacter sp.]
MCLCCFAFLFVNIGFPSTGFGVYQSYIVELDGMTHSLGSLVVSTRALVTLLATFFVAAYFKKLDCRLGITLGTCLTGAGFLVYSLAHSFPMFIVGSILAGLGYGFGGAVGMTLLVSRWYKGHYGKAAGFAAMGSGAAGAIIPVIAVAFIEHGSLSLSFLFQAVLAFLIAGITAFLLRNNPEDLIKSTDEKGTSEGRFCRHSIGNGQNEDDTKEFVTEKSTSVKDTAEGKLNECPVEGKPSKKPNVPSGKATPKITQVDTQKEPILQSFHHRLFIIAMIFVGGGSIGGVAYIGILSTSNGFDTWFTALVLSAVGIFLCVGKFFVGTVMDRIGSKTGSMIFFSLFVAGLALCCSVPLQNNALFLVGAIFYALGASLGSTGISVWSIEFSRIHNRPKVLRDFQTAYAAGGLLFNLLPGILMEIMGTYVTTFALLAVLLAVAMGIVCYVYKAVNK